MNSVTCGIHERTSPSFLMELPFDFRLMAYACQKKSQVFSVTPSPRNGYELFTLSSIILERKKMFYVFLLLKVSASTSHILSGAEREQHGSCSAHYSHWAQHMVIKRCHYVLSFGSTQKVKQPLLSLGLCYLVMSVQSLLSCSNYKTRYVYSAHSLYLTQYIYKKVRHDVY